jgi:DNA-binding NarL/FixJ family response regulator
MKVAGLIDDLFFASKMREITSGLSAEAVVCQSAESIPADVSRIFVDLSATKFDPIAEITRLKKIAPSIPVTAFVSHVQIDMRQRAERAGADEVVPRSAFAQRLSEVLKK